MENVEIRKIKPLGHKQFKAKFDVVLKTKEFGTVVLHGWRIGDSKFGGVWIERPSYQMYGQYFKLVFFETEGVWENIEEKIISACKEAGIEVQERQLKEDVNPEEVPV